MSKILERKNLYNGYLKVDSLKIINDRDQVMDLEVIKRKNAVSSLVKNTKTGKFIFVNQWRPGVEDYITETVAGTIIPGEDPQECLIREIEEEIGYKVDYTKFLYECYTSPGADTEKINIFYSEVSEKISSGGGLEEEGETINTIELSEKELSNYTFKDAKTIISILHYQVSQLQGIK